MWQSVAPVGMALVTARGTGNTPSRSCCSDGAACSINAHPGESRNLAIAFVLGADELRELSGRHRLAAQAELIELRRDVGQLQDAIDLVMERLQHVRRRPGRCYDAVPVGDLEILETELGHGRDLGQARVALRR